MKVLVYTAIFGAANQLFNQPSYPDVDYLCFSDCVSAGDTCWQIVKAPSPECHPRIAANDYKCRPHRYAPIGNYSHAIWIDSRVTLTHPDFLSICLGALTNWGIGLQPHPSRSCIHQEAKFSSRRHEFRDERVLEQALHYKMTGFPGGKGLAAGEVIVRDLARRPIEKIGEEWFLENLVWTFQELISLPYVMWRNNYWFDALPSGLWERNSGAMQT
jgi:hypothetical protein